MQSRTLYALAAVCLLARPAAAQYTNITPTTATTINVKSAEDFPTRAFQDPWDMSQRTDVGWWTWGTDTAVAANFKNPSVANGVFTGSTTGAPASLFILDTPLPPGVPGGQTTPAGKNGQQYPINAAKYTHLVYRMSSTIGGVSQYVWSTKSWGEDMTLGFETPQSSTVVQTGWKIYDINLPSLSTGALIGTQAGWTGNKESFQIIPLAGTSTATIQIDWIRLVQDDPSLKQNLTWTGGAADVYIDSDNNPANGTLGRVALNVSSLTGFFVGALPAGRYYIALHSPTVGEVQGSAGGFTYSAGSFLVNDMPTIQFTTPSAEGSSTDFATTKLGDPWDFAQKTDVDSTLAGFPGKVNVFNDNITQIPLTTEAGVSLGLQTVYLATSVAAGPGAANPSDPVGDPQIFTLFWDGKGKINRIDPNKYRILTIEAGIPNMARSLNNGSVGRVIWRAASEPVLDGTGTKVQTVGQAYAVNSAAGENTDYKISVDMKNWPVEPHSADVNTTWTSATATASGLDGFRFDPHEFAPATNWFVRRIKLAALEKTQANQFTFQWNASKAATVTISYDQDPSHSFAGTVACGPVAAAVGLGNCTWNAAAVPNGEYQIYATITDSMNNTNQVYALTNVIVDHNNTTQSVNLNRTTLYYGQLGGVHTDPQTVRLTTSGPGTTPCWTATPNAVGLITVSPTSGCGAANISIAVTGFFPAGATTTLFVTIAPSGAGDWTSQNIAVNVTGFTGSAPPTGSMDTPADGSTVSGSVAVTGWATDDIGVAGVAICRDPIMGETTTPGQCAGQPEVFIGNATFVDDARTDIQAAFSTSPVSYRAGWGYLLLSNFLPNQGNGVVRLYAWAADVDGHFALLGSKTINTDNADATKPFGAIDTPQQGQAVCGTIVNAGWVLTQRPKDILADSSTITVFIDGVAIGNLDPGRLPRADVTSLFSPAYDTSHAAGGKVIDTTMFTNGVHTIFWIVSDTGGQSDGIGSRFFTISNPCGG